MMSPFFETLEGEIPEGAHPDSMMVELEEVFHLE